jgi:hypothetical protein
VLCVHAANANKIRVKQLFQNKPPRHRNRDSKMLRGRRGRSYAAKGDYAPLKARVGDTTAAKRIAALLSTIAIEFTY